MLLLLTALSLIGFTAATLTIVDSDGNVPIESRMVFAGLSAVYVLFFNFCKDMNDSRLHQHQYVLMNVYVHL